MVHHCKNTVWIAYHQDPWDSSQHIISLTLILAGDLQRKQEKITENKTNNLLHCQNIFWLRERGCVIGVTEILLNSLSKGHKSILHKYVLGWQFSKYSKSLRCTFFGTRKNLCSSSFVQIELLNTSYLTDSYICFTLKMESVSKNTIFGLKMMVKSGLEKFILKSLHAGR